MTTTRTWGMRAAVLLAAGVLGLALWRIAPVGDAGGEVVPATGNDAVPAMAAGQSTPFAEPAVAAGLDNDVPTPAQQAAYQVSKQRLLPLLAVGSPTERLTALLLQGGVPDDARRARIVALLLEDGGAAEPAVAGHALAACLQWADCPRDQVLAATAALAAEDAHLQFLRLQLSAPDAQAALWEAASQAPFWVDPFEAQMDVLLAATHSLASSTVNDHQRLVDALGIVAATAIPNLQLLLQHCPPAGVVTERVLQCRRLARLLADSPTVFTAQVGLAVLMRQALPAAELAHWQQVKRRLDWHTAVMAPLVDAAPGYPQQMAAHGERAALVWLLRRHGRPLDPPPHWRPGQPTGW